MQRELAVADWPALTQGEVRAVLARLDDPLVRSASRDAYVTWRSPRPMSAAALVRSGDAELFVKRHHVSVRDTARLRVEHEFARHLREKDQPVARVLADVDGDTALEVGDYVYEVHEKAPGVDLYRDEPSWYPYRSLDHARAAGAALASFHHAARDFVAPASAPGVLMNSSVVVSASDPWDQLTRWMASRPALARALDGRSFEQDFTRYLLAPLENASAVGERVASQWTHGDWHPSNLTWTTRGSRARVAGVFDLGLANRTSAVHDLALALERGGVDWLDLHESGDVEADFEVVDALLDGYETVRPLDQSERAALPAVLPVVHLEFALSEVEYFAEVVHSSVNADLAYDGYLFGHVRWFEGRNGSRLVEHLGQRGA
jgi:Ser/Thr protein kinase RdoA (MazF antagonist)